MLLEGEAIAKLGGQKSIWNRHLCAFISGSNGFYQAEESTSNDTQAR